MSTTIPTPTAIDDAALQQKAKDHLWMHFSRQSVLEEHGAPIIVKGEGHHIFDSHGRRYFDGLSGLFVVNAGHGRRRLAETAARQAEELAFFPIWSYAHPAAIELADRLADHAPGDLNRVFFSTGGGEAATAATAGSEGGAGFSRFLGFIAIILASVNIFGGFLVTQRMLAMYKKKER